ncbi:MAG: molybdopterin-dependent oxidoreductase [Bauldia sp.]|nr:molybdopterin-dependent oxidoreductase [Bauldia sp.]
MNVPVRTTCPYCGVGCGVLATPGPDGSVTVAGDPEHPANFGRLCSKGSALGETVGLEERLLHPEIDERRAAWDEALDLVAARFAATIAEHGPDAVAFYVSGQLLTEDYYAANKLMKGFLGSANIDTNSRLCMASSVAGHRRAFGSDTVPGTYEDLEEADLVVLVGSNLAWCHPVLYQRLLAAKERRGTRIVVVDPRRTNTADGAELHLPLRPGSDVALFNGLLNHLAEAGAMNQDFVRRHTSGLDAALDAARLLADGTAELTGLPQETLDGFYGLFAGTPRVVTVYSQGVNQSATGTDKVNAIINCHLLTGRIGRPGAGPFSVTGQPNAMGGREVGGLANQLAAHMAIEDADARNLVGRFWNAPHMAERAGLKAVDLFRAVGDGRVKALWIMATNPVDSMPEADDVRAALAACPFVVVSDIARHTDTTAHAHVLLPAAGWGEKDGTVTNSERRISRQRPFRAPAGEARPDWWIIAEVAKRMGFGEAFAWDGPAAIFREHAALSAAGNDGTRDFDIGAYSGIGEAEYDALEPFQWPAPAGGPVGGRFFAEGGFFTPDRRARFVPTPASGTPRGTGPRLVLNTGRVRDHWHTMTRTGLSPRLSAHMAEPYVEMHPEDAAAAGVAAGTLAVVENRRGMAIGRAVVDSGAQRGSLFMPIHWTGQQASRSRVDALVDGVTDPVSGQPALKDGRVTLRPFPAAWYGFGVFRDRPATLRADYWALARARGGFRAELAAAALPTEWRAWFEALVSPQPEHELLAFHDAATERHRFALFDGERLVAALFIGPDPLDGVSRSFAAQGLETTFSTAGDRMRFLAGRPGSAAPDRGPIVCSCFEVGTNQIASAIGSGRVTIEAVGVALRAGTNCGSCRPEIRKLIAAATGAF